MPLYTSTGSLNVVTDDTTKGRYSPTGALRINLVSGTSYTGLYAADGALNVVDVSGVSISTYGGLYHLCGALRGRTAPDTYSGLQAPDGSYYLYGLSQPFTPAELFALGEQGVWYDPSDLSTLFQDAAGTTPVTAVEQPVGLRLDKSRGLVLGSELVSNGGFDSATGWTINGAGATITGGALVCSTAATANIYSSISPASTTRTFKVTWTLSGVTAGDVILRLYNNGANVTTRGFSYLGTSGTYTAYVQTSAAPNQAWITIGGGGLTGSIDNISVRELPGSHAFQTTDINRPVLSARINALVATEDFSNAVWSRAGVLAFGSGSTVNAIAAPDGTTTADLITEDTANGQHIIFNTSNWALAANTQYTLSCAAKAGTRSAIALQVNATTTGANAVFNLANGTVSQSGASADYTVSSSITALGNGWYRCSLTFSSTNSTLSTCICISNSATPSVTSIYRPTYTGDGTSGIYIWGADLRVSSDGVGLPTYQRVTTATDYDTTGFPLYLRYNGTNSTMQTPSIDFSSTDKLAVFAGVRKLSDAATGMLVELSASAASNNGAFDITAPNGTGYGFELRGNTTSTYYAPSGFASPITNVLASLFDIAGADRITEIVPRINGAVNQTGGGGAASTGTGNFGNYALYLGARAGAGLWFNGRDYGLIVLGRTPTAAEIANTEAWLNGKTAAYAPPAPTSPNILIWASGNNLTWGAGNNITWRSS